jgi:hypothetical protein
MPREPTTFHVRVGQRVLGWSEMGADRPTATAAVRVGKDPILYVPGTTACYWRSVDVYSRRGPMRHATELADDGPLPIQEVIEFGQVDNWFRGNPEEMEVGTKGYAVQIAVERDETCTTLVSEGCARQVLDDLLECERHASGADEVNACASTATETCHASHSVEL